MSILSRLVNISQKYNSVENDDGNICVSEQGLRWQTEDGITEAIRGLLGNYRAYYGSRDLRGS